MSLLTIPPEIWGAIDGHLDDEDRRHLCKCCHALMNMLQATAYSCVRMDDSPDTGRGVCALASGPRAQFVRNIQYSPLCPNPVGRWKRDEWNAHEEGITLSNETQKALESLHQFVGLEKFRLTLEHFDWDLNIWPDPPESLGSSEFNEYHLSRDEEPWRVLLEGSLLALTKSAGAFSKLEIFNLPPIPTEQPYMPLETCGWQTLLQGLTSLEITLAEYGDRDGPNLTVYHQDFLRHFPLIFLGHLPNVEHLRLAGCRNGFIGYDDEDTPIDWESLSMPRMKIFELEYSYLSANLASFLLKHSGTLERIYLKHCLGRSKSNWKDLFQRFVQTDARQLVELRIVAYPVPKRSFYRSQGEWEQADREMLRLLKEAEMKAKGWVTVVQGDIEIKEDDDAMLIEDDPDQAMSDPATSSKTCPSNNTNEASMGQLDERGSDYGSSHGDGGDAYEDAEDDEVSDYSGPYATRDIQQYVERPKPWDEVVVDERLRRFVVGEISWRYGDIVPVECCEGESDSELDESDIVESWEQVEKLMRRNMAKANLVN